MKAIRKLHSAIFEQIVLSSRLTNADALASFPCSGRFESLVYV